MDNALSLSEAKETALEYQHLTGQPFCREYRAMGVIECVAIAPADAMHKSYFLEYYQIFKDADKALSYFKDTTAFDVVLISTDSEQNNTIRDLSAHLAYQRSTKGQPVLD